MPLRERVTPYTEVGVRRLRCVRCGERAHAQWQVCADGNVYRPICKGCDIALNRLAMEFMRPPGWRAKLRTYVEALRG